MNRMLNTEKILEKIFKQLISEPLASEEVTKNNTFPIHFLIIYITYLFVGLCTFEDLRSLHFSSTLLLANSSAERC